MWTWTGSGPSGIQPGQHDRPGRGCDPLRTAIQSVQVRAVEREADAYRLDPVEVIAMAGFFDHEHDATEVGVQLESDFENLVLRPSLRPILFNEKTLPYIAPQVKRQWIDFARKLERYLALEGALTVDELLAGLDLRAAQERSSRQPLLVPSDQEGPSSQNSENSSDPSD